MAFPDRRTRHFLGRILSSPRRLLNTLAVLLSYRLRLPRTFGQPVVLDIEPTNACNFRCPHCQVTHADWVRRNLDDTLYRQILDRFPLALRVKLQGMGEPFLHKSLIDFVEQACRRGYWCEVISNGSLWHKRPMERLGAHRNFQLIVSLDAADPEVFGRVRPGSDFRQILANVRDLLARTPVDLMAWMVVSRTTQGEADAVVRLAGSLGIRRVGLQMVVVDYGKEELDELTVAQRVAQDERAALFGGLEKTAREANVQLDVADKLYSRRDPCPWPWEGVYVDVDGNVVPCCRIGDARVINMGNLRERDFDAIWNSGAYREFRRAHRDGDIPTICSACYDAGSVARAAAPAASPVRAEPVRIVRRA